MDFWNEVGKWFLTYWPHLCSALTGLVVSVASFLAYRFELRKEKAKNDALLQELDAARLRGTYTVCPHCGATPRLDELKWYLPGDVPDQNLNGKDDRLEK